VVRLPRSVRACSDRPIGNVPAICEKRTYVRLEKHEAITQDSASMISLPAELQIAPPPPIATGSGSAAKKKPRCEDCFFHQNRLCALQDKKPCPTFRLAHPDGLRPPQQLSFVFRQERRAEPFVFRPATL
jgi:hypothetical protein